MKSLNITVKLFIVTAVLFMLFITAVLFIQSIFFKDYYLQSKTDTFVSSLEQLTSTLEAGDSSVDILSQMDSFDKKYNSRTILVDVTKLSESMSSGTFKDEMGTIFSPFDKYKSDTVLPYALKKMGRRQ